MELEAHKAGRKLRPIGQKDRCSTWDDATQTCLCGVRYTQSQNFYDFIAQPLITLWFFSHSNSSHPVLSLFRRLVLSPPKVPLNRSFPVNGVIPIYCTWRRYTIFSSFFYLSFLSQEFPSFDLLKKKLMARKLQTQSKISIKQAKNLKVLANFILKNWTK